MMESLKHTECGVSFSLMPTSTGSEAVVIDDVVTKYSLTSLVDGRLRVSVANDDSADAGPVKNDFYSWSSAASYIANSLCEDIQVLTQVVDPDATNNH